MKHCRRKGADLCQESMAPCTFGISVALSERSVDSRCFKWKVSPAPYAEANTWADLCELRHNVTSRPHLRRALTTQHW